MQQQESGYGFRGCGAGRFAGMAFLGLEMPKLIIRNPNPLRKVLNTLMGAFPHG
jgi:hypothetical protein